LDTTFLEIGGLPMTSEDPDKRLRKLIAKAFMLPDLCASNAKEIEAMLDAAEAEPLSDEQLERILKKAKGELPVGEREIEEPVWSEDRLTDEEEALLALHRNEGGELSPEIQEKLRRIREKARLTPEERDDK
jgi:hypothetical protein